MSAPLSPPLKTIALFCSLLGLCQGAAADAPVLKLIAEVKGFASPESVAWDGSHYYVSNIGKELKPTDKDGDGFISRMDAKGENLQLKFIGNLNAPKGMVVVKNTLYVCDIDVLLGFDLVSKEKTFEISFAKDGVLLLNDVCAAEADKLLVSATDKNKVYLVDTAKQSFAEVAFDRAPNGPNGLLYTKQDNMRGMACLLVAEWGSNNLPNGNISGYMLDGTLLKAHFLNHSVDKKADSPMKDGYLDGIAGIFNQEGKPVGFLYSDWISLKPEGKLFWSGETPESVVSLDIPNGPAGGPADFFFDSKTSVLALPCMLDNRVLLLNFSQRSAASPISETTTD